MRPCSVVDRFAAIAPVSGTLAKGFNCAPDTSTSISIMHIAGFRDNYVPSDGSQSFDGYMYISVDDVMDACASVDSQGCAAVESPYPTSEDGMRQLECTQRTNCATGAEIVSCTWSGGHEWPRVGNHHFGNNIIWEFFSKNGK